MLVRSFARSLVVKSDFHEIWHRERKTPTEVKVKLPVGTDRQTNTHTESKTDNSISPSTAGEQ